MVLANNTLRNIKKRVYKNTIKIHTKTILIYNENSPKSNWWIIKKNLARVLIFSESFACPCLHDSISFFTEGWEICTRSHSLGKSILKTSLQQSLATFLLLGESEKKSNRMMSCWHKQCHHKGHLRFRGGAAKHETQNPHLTLRSAPKTRSPFSGFYLGR